MLLPYYLQEYCDMGTLNSVASSWDDLEEGDARMLKRLLLLKDVASGLQVLHANNVVHGDLVRSAGWLVLLAPLCRTHGCAYACVGIVVHKDLVCSAGPLGLFATYCTALNQILCW
jgi:hypothetical protein